MHLKRVFTPNLHQDHETTLQGYKVYGVDEEGEKHLVAVCPKESRRSVAMAIAAWHNVPFDEPAEMKASDEAF